MGLQIVEDIEVWGAEGKPKASRGQGMGWQWFPLLILRSRGCTKNGFYCFPHMTELLTCWDVCHKLTFCQKTFVNGKTIAFDHLGCNRSPDPIWIHPWYLPVSNLTLLFINSKDDLFGGRQYYLNEICAVLDKIIQWFSMHKKHRYCKALPRLEKTCTTNCLQS